ncbi:DUF58 domain-containing protein [Demequina globuliformis]|uniref:DUF58 domain-containing protein n=1 Tax=Demequina globuliformis TaxID=676202 RepID=UPI00078268AF|nr:DUF58 domain-containing protein [Demequina globuliformis]
MYITGWTVAITALGTIPALWIHTRTFAWLWVLAVVTLALLDAWMAPRTRSLGVRRLPRGSVRLTESTASELEVANLSRRTVRGAIRDAWQPSAGTHDNRHRVRLRAGDTVRLTTVLTPTRRGDRHADRVTIRSGGPLRLAGRQRSIDLPGTVRVLPEFASRRHLPSRLARLRELDGDTAVQLKGAGSEFDSLREYVVGDDVRTIDWRATARRADVMVKTFRPERDRRVMVVLETGRTSAVRVGEAPRLDAAMEASLLLTALATNAGDRVQVSAFDRTERARAMGVSGPAVMPQLAEALATVDPVLVEPDWPAVVRLVLSRNSNRALVVLLTTVDVSSVDSGLVEAVEALSAHHLVLVASVEDPTEVEMLAGREDAAEVYGAAAAARAGLERDAVVSRLRQMGAEVLSAAPDELAPDVADRYLALKASGRL